MPNSQQVLAMVRSFGQENDELFFSVALQIAASEAKKGHKAVANELKTAVDEARKANSVGLAVYPKFPKLKGDIEELIEFREARQSLDSVILSDKIREQLDDIILQQINRNELREYGKVPNRRALFVGLPGTGKTMTAESLARELKLPLFMIRMDGLITRYLGETASKLRLIFNETKKRRGVFLFDEFDAVGAKREFVNDVAEMRRVVNSFLQFVEEPNQTDSMIICTSNHPYLLDKALLRRFDLVVEYGLPTNEEIEKLIKLHLYPAKITSENWDTIIRKAKGLSQSEIVNIIDSAVKKSIILKNFELNANEIVTMLEERSSISKIFGE